MRIMIGQDRKQSMTYHYNLHTAKGATTKKKASVATGTGLETRAGEKGQNPRKDLIKIGFGGRQMPLHRRLPKRGLQNF